MWCCRLSLTDPSGYSWLDDNWKALVSSAVGITVAAVTGGAGAPLLLAGAAGGAASAMTGALLNGSNVGQVVKGTLTGAFWGATSSFLNNISASPNFFLSVLKHSLTEGALEGVQGGNICHGLVSGAVSGAENSLIRKSGKSLGRAGKIAVSAVMGGTASELGGGKFANGAITSAYTMMFNDLMHSGEDDEDNDGFGQRISEAAVVWGVAASADAALPVGDILGGIAFACVVYDEYQQMKETCYVTYIVVQRQWPGLCRKSKWKRLAASSDDATLLYSQI